MTEHATTSRCRSWNGNEPYEPCDCYVHDFVAELLGIVSTTGKDFRPGSAQKELKARVDAATEVRIAEHEALKKELARLEAEKRYQEDVAAVSKRLLSEQLRNQRPTVLANGMKIQYHGCSDCGTTSPGHYYAHGSSGDKVCDVCHSNYHNFTSVRAAGGASPGSGACL